MGSACNIICTHVQAALRRAHLQQRAYAAERTDRVTDLLAEPAISASNGHASNGSASNGSASNGRASIGRAAIAPGWLLRGRGCPSAASAASAAVDSLGGCAGVPWRGCV